MRIQTQKCMHKNKTIMKTELTQHVKRKAMQQKEIGNQPQVGTKGSRKREGTDRSQKWEKRCTVAFSLFTSAKREDALSVKQSCRNARPSPKIYKTRKKNEPVMRALCVRARHVYAMAAAAGVREMFSCRGQRIWRVERWECARMVEGRWTSKPSADEPTMRGEKRVTGVGGTENWSEENRTSRE